MWRQQHTEHLAGIPLPLLLWNLPMLFSKKTIALGKVRPFCSWSCRSSGAKSASWLRHIPKYVLDLFSGCSQNQSDAYFGCSTVSWQQTSMFAEYLKTVAFLFIYIS